MTFWPIFVGVSAVGVALFVFLRLKSGTKMRLATAAAKNLKGKIAIITGASSGLGREVAYQLAKLEADVVLAVRDRSKAEKAVEFIENRLKTALNVPSTSGSSDSHGKLHIMDLDLSDLRSVDTFAVEFERKFKNLHFLINNAGLMACPYSTSRGGFIQTQFAVNHLGHFHLTNLLLPILKRSTPSRILIVTSGYYRKLAQTADTADLDVMTVLDNVSSGSAVGYDPLKSYASSKLANCLHGVELAKRLSDSGVQVFVIRPGFVRGTDLGRHFSGILTTLAKPFIWMFSQTVEQGVQTYLHCALADIGPDLKSGALYYNCVMQPYSENLVNDRNAKAVWDLSERLVKEENAAIERREKEGMSG